MKLRAISLLFPVKFAFPGTFQFERERPTFSKGMMIERFTLHLNSNCDTSMKDKIEDSDSFCSHKKKVVILKED